MLLWQLLGFRDIQNKGVGKQGVGKHANFTPLTLTQGSYGRV